MHDRADFFFNFPQKYENGQIGFFEFIKKMLTFDFC